MGNSLDADGRGPSDLQLFGYGVVVFLVIVTSTVMLLLKSTGRLNEYVRVVADLVNVGDGLPARSDVKYHGLLVGSVSDVVPATHGHPNYVHIELDPEYATDIPGTVTARVVPSNVFAVSSVQLTGDMGGPAIGDGAHIPENAELPTVIFQTTISKLRDILAATARGRDDHSLGILAAIGAATDHRREQLLATAGQMSRTLDELNAIVATEPGPSTVSALIDATSGLQSSAPELFDALHEVVGPMQTFVDKKAQLTELVAGSQHTVGTTRQAFDNHTDKLIEITQSLTPVLGTFANSHNKFVPVFTRVNRLSDTFFDEAWDPRIDGLNLRVNLAFLTALYTYNRADCPRYGELTGPSCSTAPEIPVRPALPEVLLPQNYQFPAGLEPPPGTEIGPDGNLVAVGPPSTSTNSNPDVEDFNPPLPWWTGPAPRVPGTANPDATPQPGPEPPRPPGAAPSSYGGNVGPVGSQRERYQLGQITGESQPTSVATQLLLGPIARGTSVSGEPVENTTTGRPK